MPTETVIGIEEMAPGLGVRYRFLLHGDAGARAPMLQLPINKPTSELVSALEKLLAEVRQIPKAEPTQTAKAPKATRKPKPHGRTAKPRK